MMRIPIIAVVGPTASGKTAAAIEIAKRYNGEIVSADSMQIYKELSIGTAKPTQEETEGIPHHLVDFISIEKSYSVADYVRDAKIAVGKIYEAGKIPVVCGGTGLYVDSLLDYIEFGEEANDGKIRGELKKRAENEGGETLYTELCKIDPEAAEKIHPNNLGRVIRALEVYLTTGKTLSEQKRLSREKEPPYDICRIGLDFRSREILYQRIEHRIDFMLKEGLLDEARLLFEHGENTTAGQAIGYKELYPYFRGEESLDEAVETLKKETRHYAKRQLTWFRRNKEINWVYLDEQPDFDAEVSEIQKIIDESGIIPEEK